MTPSPSPRLSSPGGGRRLALLSATAFALALAGYFAPWIAHPVAPLNYSGFELTTWAKPLPAVRSGALLLRAVWLYTPLVAGGLGLALVGARRSLRDPGGWALRLLGAGLALLALPPYPAVLTAYRPVPGIGLDPEFGGQFYLAVLGAAGALATAAIAWRWTAGRTPLRPVLQLACALAGAALAPAAFSELLPSISALYDRPMSWGWGTWLSLAGFALAALVAGWELLVRPRQAT